VATVITQNQIKDLPNLERNPYSLVQLAGNVQDTPIEETIRNNVPRGVGVNINGGRSSGTHILLDGASNNFEFDTTVGQHVPLDAVQEFSVVTNNFSAQYGRATGGVVNLVTKSGTNMFSGTAYEFYRTENATISPTTSPTTCRRPVHPINPGSAWRSAREEQSALLLQFRGHRHQQHRHAALVCPDAATASASSPATRAHFGL
jgi:hypothetical protein